MPRPPANPPRNYFTSFGLQDGTTAFNYIWDDDVGAWRPMKASDFANSGSGNNHKIIIPVTLSSWVGADSPYAITIPQSLHGFQPSDSFVVFSSINVGGSDVRTNETYTILGNGDVVIPSTTKWEGKLIFIK